MTETTAALIAILAFSAAAAAHVADKRVPTLDGAKKVAAAVAIAALFSGPAFSADVPRSPVTYVDAPSVAAAFRTGAVLFDGGGTNYMVHASRRENAGQAEVHTRDTDVIYVLDGAATFVTGGTVVDGKATAPDEIRGSAIREGDTRRLARGDVIIVPAGTPHWFKHVEGPVLYYVVKVR